jgi:hypothetical protein
VLVLTRVADFDEELDTEERHKQTEINGKFPYSLPAWIVHHRASVKLNAGEMELYRRIEDKAYPFYSKSRHVIGLTTFCSRLVLQ